MENRIIEEFNLALENKIPKNDILLKYYDQYQKSKIAYSQLCLACKEWEKLDLPFDCLSRPDYCVKNKNDFEIVSKYDEIMEMLKIYE